ncbi:hypothetical protein ATK78_1357 [Pedobacter metabolipauper]|uniref:Uncharacterized protein n=1 Tax=Pedobacter metabolipauper TaxID=425513 RepID=A0A4R6SVV4_9SPHI|nr:hypothetical protein ATK78_1357 [Pedobacter metabolipauper]
MIDPIKNFYSSAVVRFRPEELFFGLSAISSVIIDYGSVAPPVVVICLLAFYYLFFGWFMFSTSNENHIGFSIISGAVYFVCLLSMTVIIAGGDSSNGFFYALPIALLIFLYWYLILRDGWRIYRSNHYVRILIILFLNLYVFVFK